MKTDNMNFRIFFPVLLGFLLCAASRVDAQAPRSSGGLSRGGGSSSMRPYYPNGMVGDAIISCDPETRRIIAITDEETSTYIAEVIRNLDQPKPQVLIKVVFLEVTYNNSSDIGIEGSIVRKINSSVTGVASNILGLAAAGAMPTPPGAGLYSILGSDLQATLRAIAQAGKTEVLSRPSILARNNQQAYITVGQSVPFITSSRTDQNGNQINTVQYQDVGIMLQVTPTINMDGKVSMIVAPEISALTDQTIPVQAGVNLPVISKRSANTVVVTPDGQTAIIGGLMQNNKTVSESKIPILGDIPLLGWLFKRKVNGNTKTELIIFLTPHVVLNPSKMGDVAAGERAKAQMVTDSFSEEELNKFLDGMPVKKVETAAPAVIDGKNGNVKPTKK